MEYKRVKLTKVGLTGRIPDGLHPNGIEVGYIEEGYMVEPPKVVVYPGSDRPYKPVSFTYNTDPPYTSRVGLLEIGRAVKQLYTEEQLFEYFFSIAE